MSVTQSLTLTQSSQNVAANTSAVRILWTSTQAGESYNNYTRTAKYYVSVNGGAEVEYSVSYTLPKGTTKTVLDTTFTVNHKTDGTGSIKVRTWMDTDISAGVVEQTKSLTLTTIPRATTPTLSASSVAVGASVTINLPRASTSFSHDLAYSFNGGAHVTFATGITTAYTWRVPTTLLSSMPNAVSGVVTIRCTTKSGSTTIGTKTVNLTVTVASDVAPTVTTLAVSEGVAGLANQFGAYIQHKSALAVSVGTSAPSGATIASVQTSILGKKYTGASFTSDVLTLSGTLTVAAQATDSRGRVSPVVEKNVSVLAYTEPRINEFDAYRVDASGNPTMSGEYITLKYDFTAPSLNGGNVVTKTIEYKTVAGSSYTILETSSDTVSDSVQERLTSPTFPSDNSYVFRLTVTDYFGASAVREVTVQTEEVILDINANGKGIAFGKVSERDGIELGDTTFDPAGWPITNGLASNTDAQADPNTTMEHLILTSKNVPSATRYFINTLFRQTKTDTAERAQLAIPGANTESLYYRQYYSGAWTNWREALTIVEAGTSGIWTYKKWSDQTVELWGVYQIANTDCTTAMGSMYRTAELSPSAFPFTVSNPKLVASYEAASISDNTTADNGALLHPRGAATSGGPPKYYLIRPTTRPTLAGKITMHVVGTW